MKKIEKLPIIAMVFPDVFKDVMYALMKHMPFLRQPWAREHLIKKAVRETERLVVILTNTETRLAKKIEAGQEVGMVVSFAKPFSSREADAEFINATISSDIQKYRKKLTLPYRKQKT